MRIKWVNEEIAQNTCGHTESIKKMLVIIILLNEA